MSGESSISLKTYIYVLGSLLFLTVITVAVSHIDFGIFNAFISVLIATIKASFVILYFMHMKHENWFHLVDFPMFCVFCDFTFCVI